MDDKIDSPDVTAGKALGALHAKYDKLAGEARRARELLRRIADASENFDAMQAAYERNSLLYPEQHNPSRRDYKIANDELGLALSAAVRFFE